MLSQKVNEFQNYLNDSEIPTSEKSTKLNNILKELIDIKINLTIIPKGRFRCMLCQKNFERRDEKIFLDCCPCLQSVHKSCFDKRMNESFYLVCFSCQKGIPYDNIKRMKKNNVINLDPMIEECRSSYKEKKPDARICSLCKENVDKKRGFFELLCHHYICKPCLKNLINLGLEANKFLDEIKCPNLMCNSTIFRKEFNEILLKDDEIGQMAKEIQKKNDDSQQNLLELSKGPDERIAECPICNEKFVLDYRSPYLSGNPYKCYICQKEVTLKQLSNKNEKNEGKKEEKNQNKKEEKNEILSSCRLY